MIRAVVLLLALAGPAWSQSARVLSGEHADFTRLVVELPPGLDWTVGRTAGGYGFSAGLGPQPDYDLATVWQRIPRSRLASLTVDATTGALSLGLGCDCHVFPFEYGAGIVVLDIKDGPPPPGSAFEAPFLLAGATAGPTTGTGPLPAPAPDNGAAGYDWITDLPPERAEVPTALPLPLDTGGISLEPLRDELLQQIARGAADGLVEMELPGKAKRPPDTNHGDLPWSNIHIGEKPGLAVTNPGALISDGDQQPGCAPSDLLDLAAWDEGRMPHDLLAAARDGLYGEFDAPDEEAVLRSARQLLYLGFGVEAGQYLDLLDDGAPGEALLLYRSMARLIDGETDPGSPFARMLECDGPAALWAALAHTRLPAGPTVNRDAILQAYQALPAHLRRHLGPDLAQKFLDHDDPEAARIIRDSMERAPEADPGSVALLDAKAKLHAGDTDAAQAHAETAVSLDGDRAESLVALVETHFRKLQPIDQGIPDALQGLQGETDATVLGPAVDRAIVLSLALSDRIDDAYAEDSAPLVLSDLWQVVRARAADDDFLRQAVLPAGTPRPDVAPGIGRAVADRLLALGFPDAALVWLGPVTAADAPDLRRTAASAEFGRGNARAAAALLQGLEDPQSEALRAKALLQLGELPAAQSALSAAGEAEAAARAALWTGDWTRLDPGTQESWRLAADQAQPLSLAEDTGLLGRGGKTVDASLATRAAIESLLASVPSPSDK